MGENSPNLVTLAEEVNSAEDVMRLISFLPWFLRVFLLSLLAKFTTMARRPFQSKLPPILRIVKNGAQSFTEYNCNFLRAEVVGLYVPRVLSHTHQQCKVQTRIHLRSFSSRESATRAEPLGARGEHAHKYKEVNGWQTEGLQPKKGQCLPQGVKVRPRMWFEN
jgi:hypothetical protein